MGVVQSGINNRERRCHSLYFDKLKTCISNTLSQAEIEAQFTHTLCQINCNMPAGGQSFIAIHIHRILKQCDVRQNCLLVEHESALLQSLSFERYVQLSEFSNKI